MNEVRSHELVKCKFKRCFISVWVEGILELINCTTLPFNLFLISIVERNVCFPEDMLWSQSHAVKYVRAFGLYQIKEKLKIFLKVCRWVQIHLMNYFHLIMALWEIEKFKWEKLKLKIENFKLNGNSKYRTIQNTFQIF